MCGDGANDCGALKAAHAGISLSETESSVASPFTSKEPNITCVPQLIREGRGALVTSFGIFKYMAVYSLTQFVSVILLYTIGANITDFQFLYIDLFLITVFAFFFGNAEPLPGPLVPRPPSASLVSLPPILSILLHMGTVIGVQAGAFAYVKAQPWFEPYVPQDNVYFSSENYTIFTVSAFQYIIMAIVFSRGKPYRKSLFRNPGLLTSLILLTSLTIYVVLWPANFIWELLELDVPKDFDFQLTLLAFVFVHFILAIIIEYGIVDFLFTQKIPALCQDWKKEKSKLEYMRIEYELERRSDWPPVTSRTTETRFAVDNETGTLRQKVKDTNTNTKHVKSLSLSIPPPPAPHAHGHEHEERVLSSSASLSRPRPRSRHSSYSSSVEQNNLQNQLPPPHSLPPADIPT
jgi:cation-transporting ATPase 13A3/4/5